MSRFHALLLCGLLLMSFGLAAQEPESFCSFPDTLVFKAREAADYQRLDWNQRYNYYWELDSIDLRDQVSESPIWSSEYRKIQVYGYSDGLGSIDLLVERTKNSYHMWMVEIMIMEEADLSIRQLDPEKHPELLLISYHYTVGGGMGIMEEQNHQIWNVETVERIAEYSTSFYMSSHNRSPDDRLTTNTSNQYSRAVEYQEGVLVFAAAELVQHANRVDRADPETNYDRETRQSCEQQVYGYAGGRFIKRD